MKEAAYDPKMSIFLAAVCGQTYTQFDNADGTFIVPKDYEVVATFKGESFHGVQEWFGYVMESTDRIIVAFRGTSSTTDWMANARARQVKYKYVRDAGWTHCGFTDIYSSLRAAVRAALSALPKHKTLYVTGHSLGGALATLCALDVAVNTAFDSPRVYTYGSPRVGDPAFAKTFSSTIGCSHRIANQYDVVPHLPPALFKIPRQDTTYYYMHVKDVCPLQFQGDSISANHIIADYFQALSKFDPVYTKQLCSDNAGFCPC